ESIQLRIVEELPPIPTENRILGLRDLPPGVLSVCPRHFDSGLHIVWANSTGGEKHEHTDHGREELFFGFAGDIQFPVSRFQERTKVGSARDPPTQGQRPPLEA